MTGQYELPGPRARVLVTDHLAQRGVDLLRETPGFDVLVQDDLDAAALREACRTADALIVRSASRVTADLLAGAPQLKVVGRAGVGVDNVDLEAATARGVVVMNTPGGNAISAAEHTLSMLLSLVKNIPQAAASMRAGKWEKGRFLSTELSGKALGIIGLGRIGSEVAKRAKAFNLRILVHDPYVSAERAEAMGVELVDLPDLYRQADFITIHVPGTKETKDLISAPAIAQMKDGVRIVNCARGGIVNEADLHDALASGKVAGAALDVFATEPTTDSPLFALPTFISTPHLGAASEEAQEAVAVEIAQQVIDFLQKGIIRNAVNAPSVPLEVLRKLQPVPGSGRETRAVGHAAFRGTTGRDSPGVPRRYRRPGLLAADGGHREGRAGADARRRQHDQRPGHHQGAGRAGGGEQVHRTDGFRQPGLGDARHRPEAD